MKLIKNIFVFLLMLAVMLAVMIACKKEEQKLKIEGTVIDPNEILNQGVPGVDLVLLHNSLQSGTFNTSFNEIQSTSTSSNGDYAFEFDRDNTVEYKITGEKDNYFPLEVLFNPDNVQPGNTYNRNFEMRSKAAVNFSIMNTSPETSSDLLTFQLLNTNFSCACCSSGQVEYLGEVVDESSQCDLYGNTWLKYFYTVDKESVFYTVLDSVFCPKFDTTYVQINY